MMSKNKLKKAIEEVCCDTCKNSWCLLKEIILSSHDDQYVRFLKQLKCLEIFKLVESEKEKRDIGWATAWERWAEQGLAKKFGEMYEPDKDAVKLFYEIVKK